MTTKDLASTATNKWLGAWTLYMREVRRFMKIPGQTVVAPAVTTLLFLAVFALALGRAVTDVGGVPFLEFLAPGLIMMAILQNAFANSSSSLIIAKVQGNIVVRDDATTATTAGSGTLPNTGSDSSLPLARLGIVLVAAGGVAIFAGQKRRSMMRIDA